jgi:hypothetical protein
MLFVEDLSFWAQLRVVSSFDIHITICLEESNPQISGIERPEDKLPSIVIELVLDQSFQIFFRYFQSYGCLILFVHHYILILL